MDSRKGSKDCFKEDQSKIGVDKTSTSMGTEETRKNGLAFSGGGIRSAAFCSGVLRRLLQKGVSIDYLSTVSGGGYTGASYMDWKFHNGKKDDPTWHKEYFEHLRQHINPLCDCYNPCRGFVDGVITIVLGLFLSIGIMLLRAFAFASPIAYIVDYFFGNVLRDQFNCHAENVSKSIKGNSNSTSLKICTPTFGSNMKDLFQLWLILFGIFLISSYARTLGYQRTISYVLRILFQMSGLTFAMVFLPWFLEAYTAFSLPWANYYVIFTLVSLMWVFIPALRDKIFLFFIILMYAYFVKWRVFKTLMLGFQYSHTQFWALIWACGILLWIHPYLGFLQLRGSHLYVKWRLKRAFFYPNRNTTHSRGCCCQYKDESLTMADLEDLQPKYKCNVTVNQWHKNTKEKNSYQILTFSSKGIELNDTLRDEKACANYGFLKPNDIKLSTAMTTSAAAVSVDAGELDETNKSSRDIKVVLGLGIGNNLIAQTGLTKKHMTSVVTLILQLLFGVLIIGLPLALYFEVLTDWAYWERFGSIIFVSAFVLMAFLAVLPIDYSNNGHFATFVRWCIINIIHVRLIRNMLGVIDDGPIPPPVLNLSDGGHVENLGLLPLFRLRLHRIVAVNGGGVDTGETYASDVLKALKQARKELRCSFTGISGRDIEEDIRHEFVEQAPGYQPRSYRFKVQYYEKFHFQEQLVGEGEVLLLMPRHPDYGIHQFEDLKWNELPGEVKLDLDESAWGSGPALKAFEVDRLSGCCFECCHSKLFNSLSSAILGGFPFHSTVNQMFTPSQFSAYHREGYRACLEGQGAEFFVKQVDEREAVLEQPKPVATSTIKINVHTRTNQAFDS